MRRRGVREESGFTLLEVMIALAIMGVGLLSIAVAQLSAIKMSNRSKNYSQAMYLAEERLEEFNARPANDPIFTNAVADATDVDNTDMDLDLTDDDNTTFTRTWTVQPDFPAAGLTTVIVMVQWNTGADTARLTQLQGVRRRG